MMEVYITNLLDWNPDHEGFWPLLNSHGSLDLHFGNVHFWDRLDDDDQWPETKPGELPDLAEIYSQKETTCKHQSVDSQIAIATLWIHEIWKFVKFCPWNWVTGE